MHSVQMRPVATYVAWSVCLFVTTVSPTKTAQRIQQTHRGGGDKGTMYGGTHWLHLANTNVFHVTYFEQCVQIISFG